MTVMYARSDIQGIRVGEGHGGCGAAHERPAGPDGLPVQPWSVDCAQCAEYLRSDPHWTASLPELPQTYDEVKAAERFELVGAKQQSMLMTAAIARLSGMGPEELSPVIRGMIAGQAAHIGPVLTCPNGHGGNVPGSRYCGQCGSPLARPAAGELTA